jgi:hypothetical protein
MATRAIHVEVTFARYAGISGLLSAEGSGGKTEEEKSEGRTKQGETHVDHLSRKAAFPGRSLDESHGIFITRGDPHCGTGVFSRSFSGRRRDPLQNATGR